MSVLPDALVEVPYGPGLIEIHLPPANLAGVVRPNSVTTRDPDEVLAQALDCPADGLTLDEYLGPASFVLIIINDATRPTPTAQMLDHILPRLKGRRHQILVATGTHRAPTPEELSRLLGRHIQDLGPQLMVHDCGREGDLVLVGRTSRGTELVFHRAAVEAGRVVVLGSVEPHYYAGYTGGRKGLMPGVAGRRSIEMNHAFALDPRARPLALKGNPCHEDMEEAVRLLRPGGVYGLNVVLNRQKGIYAAAAGNLSASFLAAAALADDVFAAPVHAQADVVVSVATPPLDNDLYQMQKVIEHGRLALKKGGILIAVSPCREGLGPSHYLSQLHAASCPEEVLSLAAGTYSLGDHKAVKIAEVKLNGDLWAVTGLSPRELEKAFITPYSSLQQAVDNALKLKGPRAEILFLPSGSLTVPVPDKRVNPGPN